MSESTDIAGSEDIILVNTDTQDTFKYYSCSIVFVVYSCHCSSEHSYRPKSVAFCNEKTHSISQAKENQKPLDQVRCIRLYILVT
jgi:hypothetical protein